MHVRWTKPATKLARLVSGNPRSQQGENSMNDQFPPPSWFMRPETWPYWMPNSLLGARTPPTPPGDTWDAPWPATSRGGILGSLTRPTEELWANPVGSDGAASGDADKLAGILVP